MKKLFIFLALVLLPSVSLAATPSEGVALKVRRGFFTDVDVGAFFTLGGANAYSNAQTYLQLGVGYDLSESIELGLNVGIGASAANCFAEVSASGTCVSADRDPNTNRPFELSDNFTVTLLNLNAAYLIKLAERFYLTPKLAAGYTLMDPAPVRSGGRPVTGGPNAGAGIGVEYATSMDHFSVGADVMVRYVIGPNIITMAIYPRVKYTF